MGVEPTRNGATIRRVNHFTTATKFCFQTSIAWRRIVLYYTGNYSSTLFRNFFKKFLKNFLLPKKASKIAYL